MKYMFLIYSDESDPRSAGSDEDMAGHAAVARDAIARKAYVTCDALQKTPGATTVRVRDEGTYITDGPFAETKEALGGFYILDCKDLEEAISYAKRIPPAKHGAIEIRPIMEIPGWAEMIGLEPASASR